MSDNESTTAVELINVLFDQLKERYALTSDAALARHIGVHDMNIMRWRRGEFGTSLKVLAPLLVSHSETLKASQIHA